MERRDFFKNMFAIGVVATIPRYDFSNPEVILPPEPAPEVLEPDKEYKAVPNSDGTIARLKDKDGKLIAYCGGYIQLSAEREVVAGRTTTRIVLDPIVLIDRNMNDLDLLYSYPLLLEVTTPTVIIGCDNVWATAFETNFELGQPVTYKGTFELRGNNFAKEI